MGDETRRLVKEKAAVARDTVVKAAGRVKDTMAGKMSGERIHKGCACINQ